MWQISVVIPDVISGIQLEILVSNLHGKGHYLKVILLLQNKQTNEQTSKGQYGPEPEKGAEKYKSKTVPTRIGGALECRGQER